MSLAFPGSPASIDQDIQPGRSASIAQTSFAEKIFLIALLDNIIHSFIINLIKRLAFQDRRPARHRHISRSETQVKFIPEFIFRLFINEMQTAGRSLVYEA